jgi:hypothetical protein
MNYLSRTAKRIQRNYRTFHGRFWAAKEKGKRSAHERLRRGREIAALQAATDAALVELHAHWKTKDGKREFKQEKTKFKQAKSLKAREYKKAHAGDDKRLLKARAAFDSFDVDGSGAIDRTEFKALLKELCVPMQAAKEIEQAMRVVDIDHSGQIFFDEFSRWYLEDSNSHSGMRLLKMRLKGTKAFNDFTGKSLTTETRRLIDAKKKAEVYTREVSKFRKKYPPPFVSHCTRAFVFPWEFTDFQRKHLPPNTPASKISNVDDLKRFYSNQFKHKFDLQR